MMNDNQDIPKVFSPNKIEKKWYHYWESNKLFKPIASKDKETFCIIMPPPNVTGVLHMGHALDATTQDILIRFKRMKGFETLWLPGMDHAGIATQSVVEKKLYREEGKQKKDYSRKEFLKKIWEWKEHHGGVIQQQQQALGSSCDWDYSLFTMDPESNEAVSKAFVDMYNSGMIFQSDYIVNWDTELQTALSDAEVEHKEVQGTYYHLKYQVKNENSSLVIATTRPETLLGDTAVAVHPEDNRFKKYIGKTAIVPLCHREVPIIGDPYVNQDKGTGCLKVTPGHDFNDFDIGTRHNLEIISILNKDGTLNKHGLQWEDLSTQKARESIIKKLRELEILIKEESVTHQVGHGQRSNAIIEPMVSKQWFVKTAEIAAAAISAVEKKQETKFFPKSWENTYFSWLRKPKDWCISRQLWWGHQIPVFTCQSCSHQWAEESPPSQCHQCKSEDICQDPDVLDTWFSSALWPFSTLGWPSKERMKKRGFDRFFPTSVLITGYDIIFFWVARMMMMSLKHLKQIPFHHIYIHAIVRDKQGRKMSKSLGNGIDPLDICNEYGADSLRFSLASDSGYNRTINLNPARIEGYRNFINKIWNAFRFLFPFLQKGEKEIKIERLTHQDKWILDELNLVTQKMNQSFDEYRFDEASFAFYQFTYEKFCSWYIEFSKPILHGKDGNEKIHRITILKYCMKKMMALLHPIAPFISEEIWQYTKDKNAHALIISEYPEYNEQHIFKKDREEMNRFIDIVTKVRSLRQSVNLPPKQIINIHLFSDDKNLGQYLEKNAVFLLNLTRAKAYQFNKKISPRPIKSLVSSNPDCEIFIPMEGVIDIEEQVARLKKEISKTEKELQQTQKKLSNKKFVEKAPKEIVFENQQREEKYQKQLDSLKRSLGLLS